MEVALRIHIVPLGFEVDRIVEPLLRMKADRAHIVVREGRERAAGFLRQIEERLGDSVPLERVACDIHSLVSCMSTYGRLVKEARDDGHQVFVNVSSGGTIPALAGMLTSMMWGAIPYYVRPERYASLEADEPISYGVQEIFEIPGYPVQTPGADLVAALDYLNREEALGHRVSKLGLIKFLKRVELLDSVEGESRQALYRALETRFVGPLRDKWGYVREEGETRAKRLRITDEGRLALRIFGYLRP